ncbi:ATP-binding protein [Rhodomicrobium sp.]|uniref:ATP-binding protein n=1 Tax=Rhodomicrobium sp. TaxID=2720632 RepID=UPI0039E559B0
MSISDAFLSPYAESVFSAVAVFGDARELEQLDVPEGQKAARRAIDTVVTNALNCMRSVGSRIVLIKGEAGSGKSHVLTTSFKRAAAIPRGEVYPAVLQLTAPVEKRGYDAWLVDALFRQLSARHFADEQNQSPLRRLAGRLLSQTPVAEQDDWQRFIDDVECEGEIPHSLKLAKRIRKEALELLTDEPPSEAFLAVLLLAGFGDQSAVNYLRYGVIDKRLKRLELPKIKNDQARIIRELGLAAQIVGASVVIGFDQVENAVRLGSEDLYVHTLVRAIRIVEDVPSVAVVIASVMGEYDEIVGGKRKVRGLAAGDRDRIEGTPPLPVVIDLGSSEFLKKVVAQRLRVLRARAKLPEPANVLEPLPQWFIPTVTGARNVRVALREVGLLRQTAIGFGRMPTQQEHEGQKEPTPLHQDTDFDKLWSDFLDSAPAAVNKLLQSTKADLLHWWVKEASKEHLSIGLVESEATALADDFLTPVIDLVLELNGASVERRQIALCEAPNRTHQLANQVQSFLERSTGTPILVRTNGFPKGRQTQVAGVLHKLRALSGREIDLGETEWHNLQRARDFASQQSHGPGFLEWRRGHQWLTQFISPLQPLFEAPRIFNVAESGTATGTKSGTEEVRTEARADSERAPSGNASWDPFPVFLGKDWGGEDVLWAPYREAPDHLNNFGFLVTGDAGSGKTQTIRVLIDAACRKSLSILIFDFKGDYCDPQFAKSRNIEVIDIRKNGLPFNPLQPPPRAASGVQPIEHAHEVAGVFSRVFKLGAVQTGNLKDAISETYAEVGIAPRDWIDPSSVSWPSFDRVFERLRNERAGASLITKLSPLCDLGLFPASTGNSSFEGFINGRVCLDLKDLPTDEIKSALAEIIIIQLHGYALRGDQPRRLTRMVVFDEAHRVKNSNKLQTLAREGRAFGIGIVIGTQFPGDIPDTMAGNLATQLSLMNNQAEHRIAVVRQAFGSTTSSEAKALLEKLGKLKPLQGLFANAHYNGVLLNVVPHHAR